MNLPLDRVARPFRTWTLALALAVTLLAFPATRSHAQYFGGGYPGMGFGYGYPGMGFGYGYPGMGYGFGYGLGLGAGFGLGSGFPSFGYDYAAATGGLPFGGPTSPTYYNPVMAFGYNYGIYAPMMGVGLTPLGTSSALTERYMLGRGLPGYSSSYGPVRYTIPANVGIAPGTGTVVMPGTGAGVVPGAGVAPGAGTGTTPGTGVGRP